MHKNIFAIAILLLACPRLAAAADMPIKAPPSQIPPPSWTGFYAGLGLGSQSNLTSARTIGVTENGVADQCPNGGQCFYGQNVNGTQLRFGFFGGYNWQINPAFLIGIEADGGWAKGTNGIVGTALPGGPFLASGFITDQYSFGTNWDASARLRAGYLVTPSFLLYATGGVAALNFSSTLTCGPDPIGTCAFPVPAFSRTTNLTRLGWTVGGGIETKVSNNVLVRGEYRYADFGRVAITETVDANNVFNIFRYDVHPKSHLALFGVSYLFGGGSTLP
jgi:outer membrane immunogenic protein